MGGGGGVAKRTEDFSELVAGIGDDIFICTCVCECLL